MMSSIKKSSIAPDVTKWLPAGGMIALPGGVQIHIPDSKCDFLPKSFQIRTNGNKTVVGLSEFREHPQLGWLGSL